MATAAQAHLIPKQLLTVICRTNAALANANAAAAATAALRHFCCYRRLRHSCRTLSDILTTCKHRVKIDLPS